MAGTPQENAALVRRFLTNVVAGGDTDAVSIFLADDVVDHNLVFEDAQGRGGVPALGWQVLAAADVDVEIAEIVAAEQQVAVRGIVTGIHRESLMDLAPTGASFEIDYVWFCHIDDGQIAAIHSLPDGLGLMHQLGAIPDLRAHRPLTEPTDHH